ncbi:hypothetical protein [Helicobacter heilmannii]|uniref:Uncharacterized protein n=1 Tax=Helicobacter heilmannii TaxID=35817 RepID=A0A0K2Y5Y1_HELHE|nr:hypothetical protein [Helicobacter heilmannii]CCM11067.1 hypothetical protein BN341_10740 [Helicobacter heilmannii ASB1.4]CRF46649.1 hypothetical protein HHE014_16640 [Helicobacter heilmannii]CRF49326.1 hypothetical protein HHE03_09340 [Helicobacter heilmannii]CRI34581.1 hypothetical protein HHE01_03820 [Helicobacter heilmannii]GMB94592.1 hypothetical protein NHP21011_06840 [Helicobacter heilmannii]
MDALFLAFCAAAWVFVCANVLLSVATFGLLSVPFFGLSLSGVVVGLFGGVSTLSLCLSVGALMAKCAHMPFLSQRAYVFLALFTLFVFVDTLGILPFGFVYGALALPSLCAFALLAFLIDRALGWLFLGALGAQALTHTVVLFVGMADIYLFLGACVGLSKGFLARRARP